MNPILFRYGGFALHYSQVIFIVAFWLAYQRSQRRAKKLGISASDWERALTYYAVGAVLGGRLGYILSNMPLFFGRWHEAFSFWHGAFTVWGAILGFWLAALVLQKFGHEGIRGLDIIAFAFPLFLGLAEWGRFTEGEGWGRVSQGFLSLEYGSVERYPLWLGFSLWYVVTALIVARRQPRWAGEAFVWMMASLSGAALVFTPFAFLVPLDAMVQYAWGAVFLVAAVLLLKKQEPPS